MEHKTDGLAVHAQRANLLVLQLLQKELGTEWLVKLKNHDIRFDGQNARNVGERVQLGFQRFCSAVIILQALHIVLKGEQPCGGQISRLPHAAPQ
jgi:hypothetical protein